MHLPSPKPITYIKQTALEMANARVQGQPNNYREKMAAYGVHDMSVLERKQEQVGLFGALFTLFEVFLELQLNAYPRAEILTPDCTVGTGCGCEGSD